MHTSLLLSIKTGNQEALVQIIEQYYLKKISSIPDNLLSGYLIHNNNGYNRFVVRPL